MGAILNNNKAPSPVQPARSKDSPAKNVDQDYSTGKKEERQPSSKKRQWTVPTQAAAPAEEPVSKQPDFNRKPAEPAPQTSKFPGSSYSS